MNEWDQTPDNITYADKKYPGMKFSINMHKQLKFLCGYITLQNDKRIHDFRDSFEVHGGVTYCSDNDDGTMTIGFDCAHWDDFIPGLDGPDFPREYASKIVREWKNVEFVKEQLAFLAEQIIDIYNFKIKVK